MPANKLEPGWLQVAPGQQLFQRRQAQGYHYLGLHPFAARAEPPGPRLGWSGNVLVGLCLLAVVFTSFGPGSGFGLRSGVDGQGNTSVHTAAPKVAILGTTINLQGQPLAEADAEALVQAQSEVASLDLVAQPELESESAVESVSSAASGSELATEAQAESSPSAPALKAVVAAAADQPPLAPPDIEAEAQRLAPSLNVGAEVSASPESVDPAPKLADAEGGTSSAVIVPATEVAAAGERVIAPPPVLATEESEALAVEPGSEQNDGADQRDQPGLEMAEQEANTSAAEAVVATASSAETGTIWQLDDLNPVERGYYEALDFSGHLYSSKSANRFIIVDGKARAEREAINARTSIKSITEDGVVLLTEGTSVFIDIAERLQ